MLSGGHDAAAIRRGDCVLPSSGQPAAAVPAAVLSGAGCGSSRRGRSWSRQDQSHCAHRPERIATGAIAWARAGIAVVTLGAYWECALAVPKPFSGHMPIEETP